MFSLIITTDIKNGISLNGEIPWKQPDEYYAKLNSNVCIMGIKTWNNPIFRSINCTTAVLKHKSEPELNPRPNLVFYSIDECMEYFSTSKFYKGRKLFVVGGASIYRQFIDHKLIHDVHVISMYEDYNCDKFIKLPKMKLENEIKIDDNITYREYYTINKEEDAVLQLMSEIMRFGNFRDDRTGAGTVSLFSRELRFDLSKGNIPMITTRPLSLKIIFEELMWILRGQTDNSVLKNKNINIWEPNTTREFLDSISLDLPEGDIGASYGFQMRHFGAEYITCRDSYDNKGFDQLMHIISLLKNNPTSRRILINLYNPTQLNQMALPPCVYGYQFYVANDVLSCKLIQRSSDIALAGSHNCVSGALFVRMLCCVTGLKPGELIWSPGDIHIYNNQIESVREQLERNPKPFPILKIINSPDNILDFTFECFQLLNYSPYPRIQFAMNA